MVRDISKSSLWPPFRNDVKKQVVSKKDHIEEYISNKKSVIIVDINLYLELLMNHLDILKRCNVIIMEGRMDGEKSRGSSG